MAHPAKLATPEPLDVTGLVVQVKVAVGPLGCEAMASCTGSPPTAAPA